MAFTTSPQQRTAALQGHLDYQRFVDIQNARRAEQEMNKYGVAQPTVYGVKGGRAPDRIPPAPAPAPAAPIAADPAVDIWENIPVDPDTSVAGVKSGPGIPVGARPLNHPAAGPPRQLRRHRGPSHMAKLRSGLIPGVNAPPWTPDPAPGPVLFSTQDFARRIGILESSGGKFQNAKGSSASGTYHVTNGTATGPQDAELAALGLRPARSNSKADKDEYAIRRMDALLRYFNGDQTKAAIAWKQGFTAAKNWDGAFKSLHPDTQQYLLRFGIPNKPMVATSPQPQPQTPTAPQTLTAPQPQPQPQSQPQPQPQPSKQTALKQIPTKAGVTTGATTIAQDITTKPISKLKPPRGFMPFALRSEEMRNLRAQRAMLKQQIATAIYTPGAMTKLRSQFIANSAMIDNLAAQQAIDAFEISEDPTLLAQILSQQSGNDIRIGRAGADKWYMLVNGKEHKDLLTKKQIISEQRRRSSKKIHDGLKQAAATAIAKSDEAILKSILGIREQHVIGNYKLQAERLKKLGIIKGIEQMFRQTAKGTEVLALVKGEDGVERPVWQPIDIKSGNSAYKL